MECKKCGAEVNGAFCTNCGTSVNDEVVLNQEQPKKAKKPIFKKWWFWVAIVVVLIIIIASVSGGDDSGSSSSGGSSAISLESANVVEDTVQYEIINVFKSSKVQAPMGGGLYYSPESGNEYIIVEAKVKSLLSQATDLNEVLTMSLTVNGQVYAATAYELSANDSDVSQSWAIEPLTETKMYFACQVPIGVSTDGMVLSVTSGGKTSTTPVSIADFESEKTFIEIGKEITDGETLSATVEKVYFTSKISPSNPDGFYSYYEAENGKIYLAMKVKVKNLKGDDLQCEDIAGVKCVYNDKYEYDAASCVEEDEGSDLTYTSITSIAPLDTTVMYYYIEMPKDAENGGSEISMYILGETYYYKVG